MDISVNMCGDIDYDDEIEADYYDTIANEYTAYKDEKKEAGRTYHDPLIETKIVEKN